MALPKKYIHDHFILLLASVNVFIAGASVIFILIRLLDSNHSGGYIFQYRPSLGVGTYQTGNVVSILSFGIFAALIVTISLILSYQAYKIHRQVSIVVLSLGVLLLGLNVIITNSLLQLR